MMIILAAEFADFDQAPVCWPFSNGEHGDDAAHTEDHPQDGQDDSSCAEEVFDPQLISRMCC